MSDGLEFLIQECVELLSLLLYEVKLVRNINHSIHFLVERQASNFLDALISIMQADIQKLETDLLEFLKIWLNLDLLLLLQDIRLTWSCNIILGKDLFSLGNILISLFQPVLNRLQRTDDCILNSLHFGECF